MIPQMQNGVEKVICNWSRKLAESDKECHIIKLELLSVTIGLEMNKFSLYPKTFTLRVDNIPLCFMKTLNPPGRLVAWPLYILSNYNFNIEHRKSEEISNVDHLSCDGCPREPTKEELE